MNGERPGPGDFELEVAESEGPEPKHGPLVEVEPPPQVWARPASQPARRARPSKGWRRHLRRAKALARRGRSSS